MIRGLILLQGWGQDQPGTPLAYHQREFDGVGHAHFQVGVAVEFNKFQARSQEFSGTLRFGAPLPRCAMGGRFPSGTDDQMGWVAGTSLSRNHTTTTEFDVVGMRAKSQQRPLKGLC